MNFSTLPTLSFSDKIKYFLMSGPCAIGVEKIAMEIAEKIVNITQKLKIPFVFMGSFKKANRSRMDSFTGIGDEKALEILQKVGEKFNVPKVTDINGVADADKAGAYEDVLQIPAFFGG